MAQQSIISSSTGLETLSLTNWRPGISLVYPMFNEEENIERAVCYAEQVLTDMTANYEIVIGTGYRADVVQPGTKRRRAPEHG